MENKKYEYMLHVWGGFQNDGNGVPQEIKDLAGYTYFDSRKDLDNFMKKFNPYKHHGFAYKIEEGELSHKRTIAKMNLRYKEKIYPLEFDFGYEYPEDSARFMFFDGNYSCDCNLSLFIGDYLDEEFEELDCGNEIDILDFEVVYKD